MPTLVCPFPSAQASSDRLARSRCETTVVERWLIEAEQGWRTGRYDAGKGSSTAATGYATRAEPYHKHTVYVGMATWA